MKGIIIGDVLGSGYERDCYLGHKPVKYDFEFFTQTRGFTDDTLLSLAVMEALTVGGSQNQDLFEYWIRLVGNLYIETGGFGGFFKTWLQTRKPYASYGNGGAMRVLPVVHFAKSLDEVYTLATKTALCTHSHVQGLTATQAVAVTGWLIKQGQTKKQIKEYLELNFPYDLNIPMREMRKVGFSTLAFDSVPNAISCFLKSTSFEDGIRKACSLNGDTDTQAAITGGLCELYYGVDKKLWLIAENYLEPWMKQKIKRFYYNHVK